MTQTPELQGSAVAADKTINQKALAVALMRFSVFSVSKTYNECRRFLTDRVNLCQQQYEENAQTKSIAVQNSFASIQLFSKLIGNKDDKNLNQRIECC